MYIGSEQDYQKYEQLKLNQQFADKGKRDLPQNLEAQQMEEMDFQEESSIPTAWASPARWARRSTGDVLAD